MTTDVFSAWEEAGYSASGFPTAFQPVLTSQNTNLVSQTGHFDPNAAFIKALVNAVNAALGG